MRISDWSSDVCSSDLLRSRIAQFEIARGADGAGQRRPEAGPARAAVELGLRTEKPLPATGAGEDTGAMFLVEGTGEGIFSLSLAQHLICYRPYAPAPLRIASLLIGCAHV